MKLNREYKDSIFTSVFNQPEYTKKLYQAVHKEDIDISEDDIEITTLSNVLTNQPYNDLSFKVKDKLFIFVEAQSTWSDNILYRLQHYVTDVERRYIEENNINIYSSSPVKLPAVELYCIYTGDRKDRPEEISLSHTFFNDQKLDLDVTVHFLYGDEKDIIQEYVTFCNIFVKRIVSDNSKYEEFSMKSLEEVLDECYNKDILKDFVQVVRKEVASMYELHEMMTQEYATKMYQIEIERDKKEEREKGLHDGRLQMLNELLDRGIISKNQYEEFLDSDQ